jgi:hypothetical protein
MGIFFLALKFNIYLKYFQPPWRWRHYVSQKLQNKHITPTL